MSANINRTDLRIIPLAALSLSTTPAQIERRAHFDKTELEELADSIKTAGVLQAILVRGKTFDQQEGRWCEFEVVAGERRVMAARKAGLEEIPATVRELTDDQVVELQLIENLQRSGLHELAEAEGYEQLLKHGHSTEEIAEKVGKSKGYVYARMKLLALGAAAREAFYRGELGASTALLLARIPVPSVQREACGKITKPGYGGPLSYREARDLIEREYMLRLSEAPFDTKLDDLVKGAVACGRCPKNTLSQPELFGDVKSGSAGVCTDPTCFKAKREAGIKRQVEEARAHGQTVITGSEAKKIAPHGQYSLQGGYVRLDSYCHEDAKNRTFKQLLGRSAKPAFLQTSDGDLIPIVNRAQALKQAKDAGTLEPISRGPSSSPSSKPKDKAAEKIEKEFRRRLFLAIHAKAPKKLSRDMLATLAEHEFDMIGIFPDEFLEAWGLKDEDRNIPRLEKLTEPQLCQMLWELLIVEELHMGTDEHASQKLTNVAKSLGIDHAAIRKEVAAGQKAEKPEPVKAPKKTKGNK